MFHCYDVISSNHRFGAKSAPPLGAFTAAASLLRQLKMCKTQLILAACETFLSLSRSCLGRLSASTSSPLPAPTLYIYSRSKGSVVLACRTPEGHRGDTFMLFRYTDQVYMFFEDVQMYFCFVSCVLGSCGFTLLCPSLHRDGLSGAAVRR